MGKEATSSFIIRDYEPQDEAFIISSWLKSFREGNGPTSQRCPCGSPRFPWDVPQDIYYECHHAVVCKILQRTSTTTKVAVDPNERDLIYGYAVFEEIPGIHVFHYIYVKKPFSDFGIARKLIESAPFEIRSVYASHKTHVGKRLIERLGLTYCPYLT